MAAPLCPKGPDVLTSISFVFAEVCSDLLPVFTGLCVLLLGDFESSFALWVAALCQASMREPGSPRSSWLRLSKGRVLDLDEVCLHQCFVYFAFSVMSWVFLPDPKLVSLPFSSKLFILAAFHSSL